jgi:tRNA (cytidine/uridine-2'-O-)-methyltransferase
MLNVVLYQPAIPPNTGNVSRQCVGMNAHLHLIAPKFEVSDNTVKRAGLDYWPYLKLTQYPDDQAFLDWLGDRRPWLVTKLGVHRYDTPAYADGDILIFGNENTGLPEAWHQRWPDRTVHIPIMGEIRSFNLSNTVAIVLAQATLTAGLYPTNS